MHCTVVLLYIILLCIVLLCIVLLNIILLFIVLFFHCTVVHCTVMYCTVVHCTVVHCIIVHCCNVYCCSSYYIFHYIWLLVWRRMKKKKREQICKTSIKAQNICTWLNSFLELKIHRVLDQQENHFPIKQMFTTDRNNKLAFLVL